MFVAIEHTLDMWTSYSRNRNIFDCDAALCVILLAFLFVCLFVCTPPSDLVFVVIQKPYI